MTRTRDSVSVQRGGPAVHGSGQSGSEAGPATVLRVSGEAKLSVTQRQRGRPSLSLGMREREASMCSRTSTKPCMGRSPCPSRRTWAPRDAHNGRPTALARGPAQLTRLRRLWGAALEAVYRRCVTPVSRFSIARRRGRLSAPASGPSGGGLDPCCADEESGASERSGDRGCRTLSRVRARVGIKGCVESRSL